MRYYWVKYLNLLLEKHNKYIWHGFPIIPTQLYIITYRQGKQLIDKHENNINNTTWQETITYDANTLLDLECSTYLIIIINTACVVIQSQSLSFALSSMCLRISVQHIGFSISIYMKYFILYKHISKYNSSFPNFNGNKKLLIKS